MELDREELCGTPPGYASGMLNRQEYWPWARVEEQKEGKEEGFRGPEEEELGDLLAGEVK